MRLDRGVEQVYRLLSDGLMAGMRAAPGAPGGDGEAPPPTIPCVGIWGWRSMPGSNIPVWGKAGGEVLCCDWQGGFWGGGVLMAAVVIGVCGVVARAAAVGGLYG